MVPVTVTVTVTVTPAVRFARKTCAPLSCGYACTSNDPLSGRYDLLYWRAIAHLECQPSPVLSRQAYVSNSLPQSEVATFIHYGARPGHSSPPLPPPETRTHADA